MKWLTHTGSVLVLTCLSFFLVSCSSEFSSSRDVGGFGAGLGYGQGARVGVGYSGRLPWEIWPLGLDLSGKEITDPYIVKADELIKLGKRTEALDLYNKAKASQLPFITREALVARIASTQLALDKAKESLVTLSQFFRDSSLDTDKVEAQFAIIFAYAYGRMNDIDQSLAWFSRLNSMAGGRGALSHSANLGLALLLRTINSSDLNTVSQIWSADPFIYANISEERRRRQRLGSNFTVASKDQPFWLAVAGPSDSSADPILSDLIEKSIPLDPNLTTGSGPVVGVLLPLSGRYSNLGQSTIRGIEVALLDSSVKIIAKDDMGDSNTALQATRTMLAEARPEIVLGPLLSDSASQVVPYLKEIGVPELSFSRKELPIYGDTAFQLGASISSQIESILNVTGPILKLKRYAIVYPDNSTGFEFVRDFRRMVAESGYNIAFEASYGEDYRQTMLSIVEQLETSDVDAIFFPDDIDKATVLISNLTPAFRKKVKVIGSAAWDDVQKLSSSKTLLEGTLFVSPFFDRSSRELVVRFKEIYKKRYGVDPDFLAAQGFDAATLALAAINRQRQEGLPFLSGFRAIDQYDGLTGWISVDPDGRFKRLFSMVELSESGLREISVNR